MLSKPFQRFPLLSRFVLLLLLLLGAGQLAFSHFAGRALPPPRQQLFAPGALAPVFIARDGDGVPQIQASSDEDAYFAIGYAHAQDRLWQLELQRRTVRGEMSEVLGQGSVRQDIWYRALDLPAAAQSAWPALSAEARGSLQKYVDGINTAIAAQSELPVEFGVFGIRPHRWTPIDALARLKLFAFLQSSSFQLDLSRDMARQRLSSAQLRTLFPGSALEGVPAGAFPAAAVAAAAAAVVADGGAPWDGPLMASGSAWAVSGRHAEGGAALLANTPLQALQIPSPWYAVRVRGAHLAVDGMTLVGLPLVLFGHNARVSWGGASVMADTQDVYLENTDPARPDHYATPAGWRVFDTRRTQIRVRADSASPLLPASWRQVDVRLRASRNGPLLSEHSGGFDHPAALRWSGFDAGDTSYEALFRLQYAHDWAGFRAALSVHVTPVLSMVYADVDGNIGTLAAGRVPLRPHGGGAVPARGWDQGDAWTGYVPAAQMPERYNPTDGFVVASEALGIGGAAVGRDSAATARTLRITRLLEQRIGAGQRLGLADMRRIQGDVVDLDAAALAVELLKMRPNNAAQTQAWQLLRDWDGAMAADSPAAAIFGVWSAQLRQRLLDEPLTWYWNQPEQGGRLRVLQGQMGARALREALEGCGTVWTPSAPRAGQTAGCAGLRQSTLQAALDQLGRLSGSATQADWHWGMLQQGHYQHQPMSQWQPFSSLFERPAPSGGGANSANAATSVYVERQGFVLQAAASCRQLTRLSRGGVEHEFMNSTGQSGDPASPHYADMVAPFARLDYIRMPVEPAVPSAPAAAVVAADVLLR